MPGLSALTFSYRFSSIAFVPNGDPHFMDLLAETVAVLEAMSASQQHG